MEAVLKELYDAILDGNRDVAKACVEQGLAEGIEPGAVLDAMVSAMGEVGRLFEDGEYFVPEMLIAARAMKTGMEILKPQLVDADIQPAGKIVAGTVKGDLHDIGKNLVCMMLEGAGFQVVDLGVDVDPGKFVQAAQQHKADVVALSALLTTTMPAMQATVNAVREAGLATKVIVGGAPVTQAFADQIGADGYSSDAPGAVELARRLVAA